MNCVRIAKLHDRRSSFARRFSESLCVELVCAFETCREHGCGNVRLSLQLALT